jgi:hypothetical protein
MNVMMYPVTEAPARREGLRAPSAAETSALGGVSLPAAARLPSPPLRSSAAAGARPERGALIQEL